MKVKYTGAHPSLTPGKVYRALGIEGDDYRILDDKWDPCLYECEDFEIVDSTRPSDWIVELYDEDGDEYTIPKPLNRPYFYEAYHDYNPYARREFEDYLASINMSTARGRNARNVKIGTEARRLEARYKEFILEDFPSREREIRVVALKGDPEAFQLAEQFSEFLKSEGYSIWNGGVNQTVWDPPVWGVDIIMDSREIRVGTNIEHN